MAGVGGSHPELITEETTDNKNSSGDSGIQISQRDEDLEHDDKAQESDADEKSEDTAITDPSEQDTVVTEQLKEENAITDPPKADTALTDSTIEDNAMIDSPIEDNMKTEETNVEKKEPKENNNLMTVELTVKECDRNSPEIVIEPTFPERLSSGKNTPQSIRAVTPQYRAVPVGVRLTSQPLQTRSFFKNFKHCMLLILFTAIVIGYAVGGAYLFSHLERKREIEYNAKIDKWKNDTAILLATELRQVKPHEEVWARKVFHYLEVFEKDLLKASAVGYRRQDHKDREQRWTWTSSLFFSIALMTTTGYGPMTPRSKVGRIAAVFYSIFGIPLALFWFMIIGYSLATFWVSLFQNICCRLCHENPPESPREIFSATNQKELLKLPKLRSNSIVPIEEQKLIVHTDSLLQQSAKVRRSMFPEDLHSEFVSRNNHPVKNAIRFQNRKWNASGSQLQTEFVQMQEVYNTMDYAVAIIYAFLLFVVYYIFFSIFFALYERWILTDILYFSYLMFVTLGPGCHELESDGAEIKIKNNLLYTVHLCIGYCILAMIVNLIYMMLSRKSEKVQKHETFDSFHREKF